MKKATGILSVMLAVIMALSAPLTVFASTKLKSKYTDLTYTHQTKFDDRELVYGIDVSEHNGEIDFNKVKNDGIEFAFIRVGYTGYTKSTFSLNYDKNYKTYINDAKQAGLKVGVYWYSQALNTSEAVQEADKLLKGIKGYSLDMPVVYDYEFADTPMGRLDSAKLSAAAKTENTLAFLDTVAAEGYEGCLYASENFLIKQVNAGDIADVYQIWLANYSTKTSYAGDFDYWQYTSRGSVNGVNGKCDVNFWYVDNNSIQLDTYAYTGAPITPEPVITDESNSLVLTKDIDYTLSYSNNISVGTAAITANGIGAYTGMTRSYKFDIVPANVDSLVYIGCTETTLSYSWNEVAGACEYKLCFTNINTGKTYYKSVKTNSATISNLTAGNSYTVKIAAGIKNSKGGIVWGSYSAEDTRTLKSSVVTGLAVSASTTKSITLKWNVIPDAESYNVYMYNSSSDEYNLISSVNAPSCKFKVTGLKAGKDYKFRVSAVANGVEGKKSTWLKAATKPNQVKLSSVKAKSGRKIAVSWKSTTSTGYQLQWSTNRDFSKNYKTVTVASGKSKTITAAQSKKKYYVRVRAYKTVNRQKIYGKWSSVKSIKTK